MDGWFSNFNRLFWSLGICCVIIFISIFNIQPVCCLEGETLFNSSDFVTDVDYLSINNSIYNQRYMIALEFYSSWCGHCIRYAPIWQNLSVDLRGWRPVVRLFAMNCAEDQHFSVCGSYEIPGYPALMIFNVSTPYGKGEELTASEDFDGLRHTFLRHILHTPVASRPSTWPELTAFRKMEDVFTLPSDKQTVILIDKAHSVLAKEVILDMAAYSSIRVFHLLPDEKHQLDLDYPKLLHAESPERLVILDLQRGRYEFSDTLRKYFKLPEIKSPKMHSSIKPSAVSATTKPSEEFVTMQDLESCLHYILRQEIPGQSVLHKAQILAVKQLLSVLIEFFPSEPHVHDYLQLIHSWLMSGQVSILGMQWLHQINSIQTLNAYLPMRVKWIACHGSKPHYRGYPCGLWTLFHVLTVQASRRDSLAGPNVLLAIREYIDKFFGCRECANHFTESLKNIDSMTTSEEVVMGLWKVHNKVNARLQGDLTEDPTHLKRYFPSKGLCPSCGKDESKIFKFLVTFYSEILPVHHMSFRLPTTSHLSNSKAARHRDMMKLVEKKAKKKIQIIEQIDHPVLPRNSDRIQQQRNFEEKTRHHHIPNNLNMIDFSMCVLVYIVSIIILILLYSHVVFSRKCSHCYK